MNRFIIYIVFLLFLLLIKLNMKVALFLCSSFYREMQKFKRDFSGWCVECNQEKKDKKDRMLSAYDTTGMVNNCVICILHAHALHSWKSVSVVLISVTWLPTL
jgi:hypothetical protein